MLEMTITADPDMEASLKRLAQKTVAQAADEALQVALIPCVACMTAYAPEKINDGGALKRSFGYRIKKYQGGKIIFAVAGPMRGVVGPHGEIPTLYAHLVEFGHRIVGHKTFWGGRKDTGKHVPAHPFMRPAWEATKDQVNDTIGRELGARVEAAVRLKQSARAKS